MIEKLVGLNSRDEIELLRDIDFKKMMENMQVMFCMYDMDGYFYVNSVFERIMGYTNEEMQKKKFWEIVHPDEWGWIIPRGTARLRGEKVPPTKEFRIVKKSGEVLWVNVYYQLHKQVDKNIIFIAFIDVSDNKRLAEELRVANEELETRVNQRTEELNHKNKEMMFINQKMNNILQNMSDGVLVVDTAGNIEILNSFFNQKSEKLIDEISTVPTFYLRHDVTCDKTDLS
jgi:PAS domain S-box-containing protein